MLEQPAARIFDREHLPGAAEWLTGRPTNHQIGRPILGGAVETKVFRPEVFDARMRSLAPSRKKRSLSQGTQALWLAQGVDAIVIAIDGGDDVNCVQAQCPDRRPRRKGKPPSDAWLRLS